MDSLTTALTGIFLPIILGIAARTGDFIPAKNRPVIQQFAVRIAIPALIFSSLRTMDGQTAGQFLPMSLSLFLFMGSTWLILWGVILILRRKFAFIRKYQSELLLVSYAGNLAYICWQLHSLLIGPEGMQRGIFYTAFYWPSLLTFAMLTVLVFRLKQEKELNKREFAYNLIPIFAMLFLGLAAGISGWQFPRWFIDVTDRFGSMAIPIILFSMGLSISLRYSIKTAGSLIPFLLIRLAVWVGITFLMIRLPWFDGTSRHVLLINSMAPLGINPIVVSDMFGLDTEFVANATVISTVLFLFFIPLMFFLWA